MTCTLYLLCTEGLLSRLDLQRLDLQVQLKPPSTNSHRLLLNILQVTTDDGFLLGLHRIPFGYDDEEEEAVSRQPVFLQHGLLQVEDTHSLSLSIIQFHWRGFAFIVLSVSTYFPTERIAFCDRVLMRWLDS